jgi:hypothetical protein
MRSFSLSSFGPSQKAAIPSITYLWQQSNNTKKQIENLPEGWMEYLSDHFKIMTDGSIAQAKTFSLDAEKLFVDLQKTFPDIIPPTPPHSLLRIYCYTQTTNIDAMKKKYGRTDELAGFFDGRNSHFSLYKNLSLKKHFNVDMNKTTIRHELTHHIFSHVGGIMPSADDDKWIHEGLACYMEGEEKNRLDKRVRLTRVYMIRKLIGKDIAMADVIKSTSKELNPAEYYSGWWSIVHFAMHAKQGKHKAKFLDYVKGLKENGSSPHPPFSLIRRFRKNGKHISRCCLKSTGFRTGLLFINMLF